MSAQFKAVDRQTLYLFPPSVEDWLDQKHLARFIVDVVSKLDLHELKMPYSGGGSEAYHPEMLLALLFYGYATGVFSSRKLEQATYDSIAFRYITANTHPDHDTIATFRKRFLEQLKPLFVQILLLAKMLGFLQLGKISLDGSKIQANASKHSALSWGHAVELEQQLKEEVARLMALAEAADTEKPEAIDIPAELAIRDQRLKAISEAKAKLEARAAERHATEQAEYEAKKAERQAKAQSSGRPPRGPEPKAPEPGVRDNDQINLTDEESRILPTSGKSFQQAYNVQAGVETESLLIVTQHVTQNANDKREVAPTLKALDQLPESLGKGRSAAGRQRLLQRAERQGLCRRKTNPLHCCWARRPPSAAGTALGRSAPAGCRRRCRRDDETPAQDPPGPGHLRASQMHRGTRVWNHQIGVGLSTVSLAWPQSRLGRMDAGEHGLEPEAHVCSPTAETASSQCLKLRVRVRQSELKQHSQDLHR